ncbi:hypothetical protein GGGNBK_00910 [Sporosarcina sp. ANT_H38]
MIESELTYKLGTTLFFFAKKIQLNIAYIKALNRG